MMANEIGAWLWIFADEILLITLAAILLSGFVIPSLRGSGLMQRLKNHLPAIRQQIFGKPHHPQKTV